MSDRAERDHGLRRDAGDDVVGAGELSRSDVEQIAVAFAGIWQEALFTAVHRSGRLLLDRVYGGDVELFHRPGPKHRSLPRVARALAARGVRISVAQLRRTIHRHLVLEQLGGVVEVESLQHVRPSHLDEVAPLPERQRVELLLRCERQRLSVAALRALCSGSRAALGAPPTRRAPRRPSSGVHARAQRLEVALDDVRRHESRLERVLGELARVGVLDRETRIEVLGVALRLKRQIEHLESKLARVLRE